MVMKIEIKLPDWLIDVFEQKAEFVYSSIDKRAKLAVELSRLNIEHRTGGPFGAAVFDLADGRLISVGVNVVEKENCSVAHAEIIALMLAEKKLETFSLGKNGKRYQLVSSCEPCAMCCGAIPWSGISSVICCGRKEDATAVGFDEGDKPNNWAEKYANRGIEVIRDVLREEATRVLKDYIGNIYNGKNSNAK